MPWFKVDDNFYDHPKVDELPVSAVGVWTLAGAYSARHLTDGFIPASRVSKLGGSEDDTSALVSAGLWDEAEGGFQFHNWDEYQPTKSDVESRRDYERDRKARQRRNKAGQFTESEECPTGTPDGTTSGTTGGSHTVPTRPDPTRTQESARKRPAHRLPADWSPSDAHRKACQDKNLDLVYEATRFRNHAEANDRRQVNWNSAFSNWLLNARPRQREEYSGWDQTIS